MLKRYLQMTAATDAGSGGASGATGQQPGSSTAPTTAPTNPPAQPAAPAAAPTVPATAPAHPNWASNDNGFDDDSRMLVTTKKYEKPGDVAKALLHAQKFIGAPPDEIERFPKDGLDDTARERVLTRLGAPKTAEGYGLKAGEGDDPETLAWFGQVATKARLTVDQAKMVMAEHSAKTNELIAAQVAQNDNAKAAAAIALKAKWGNNYDRNLSIAENVVGALTAAGLPKEFLGGLVESVGHTGLVEGFYSIAKHLGEDKFITSKTPVTGGGMDVATATARKREMMADREGFAKRMATNSLTAKEKAEWEQVNRDAHPE